MVKILILHGAVLNVKNKNGRPPIYFAKQKVREILKPLCKVNYLTIWPITVSAQKRVAYQLALEKKHIFATRLLEYRLKAAKNGDPLSALVAVQRK